LISVTNLGAKMKIEFVSQYNHTWRVFAGIVKDFEEDSWFYQGTGSLKPACHSSFTAGSQILYPRLLNHHFSIREKV
jgi:hypothetical protein